MRITILGKGMKMIKMGIIIRGGGGVVKSVRMGLADMGQGQEDIKRK